MMINTQRQVPSVSCSTVAYMLAQKTGKDSGARNRWCQSCKKAEHIGGQVLDYLIKRLGIHLEVHDAGLPPGKLTAPCEITDLRLCTSCVAKLVAMFLAGIIQPNQVTFAILRDPDTVSKTHHYPKIKQHDVMVEYGGKTYLFEVFCQLPGLPRWCRKRWMLSDNGEHYVPSGISE